MYFVVIFSINLFSESYVKYDFNDKNIEYDYKFNYIKKSTSIIIGSMGVSFGILFSLPEDFTNWNTEDIKNRNIFNIW